MAGPQIKQRSLIDDDPKLAARASGNGGKSKGGKAGAKTGDKIKAGAAVIVIIASAVALAAYFGVFSPSPAQKPTIDPQVVEVPPEQAAQADQDVKRAEETAQHLIESGQAIQAGGG